MTHTPHIPTPPADAATRRAVDQAKALVAAGPQGAVTPSWTHASSHVGDLAILALASRA